MAFDLDLKYVVDIQNARISHFKKMVLQEVSFKLAEAEFVYLLGNSGSGKSTLIKSLYGACHIEASKAEVCRQDLLNLNNHNLPFFRRKLGIIFQEFHLFPNWDIFSNLDFILKATGWNDQLEIEARVGEVLQAVGLGDSNVKDPVYELSGGQKQRLVIARAMLNKPRFIIADEPTGNLDQAASNEILNLIHKISSEHNTTILFATHDVGLMDRFPARTIKCENGTLLT